MSKFALMTGYKRAETLRKLYKFSISKDAGFLMPFLVPLYENNGGCYGSKKRFYSPNEKYKCKDEKAIDDIFKGK